MKTGNSSMPDAMRKPAESDHQSPALQPQQRPARVLVADDDPGISLLLKETLDQAGFHALMVGSGAEAVAAFEDFDPDLILMDINMPGMDGISACGAIRKLARAGIPIVMVTSVDDATSIQLAFDAGATDFIIKPINWPVFQHRVESIVRDWNRVAELTESEKRLAVLQRVAPEQVLLVSRSGVVIEDLKARSGTAQSGGAGNYPSLADIFGPAVAARFKQCISSVLKTCKTKSIRFVSEQWGVESHCQAEFQVDGRERVIVIVQFVGDDQEVDAGRTDASETDPATELPNERLFAAVSEKACANARLTDRSLVLMSIGFDESARRLLQDERFLREAARSINASASTCSGTLILRDGDVGQCLARVEEDEFALLFDSVEPGAAALELTTAIRDGFASAHDLRDMAIELEIGVASLPTDGGDPETLLAAARAARREAQVTGRATGFYSTTSDMSAPKALDYARELRDGIDKQQLELHFQPRVAPLNGRVTCIEALLRWNHPMRGYVELGEILDIAKATGLIFEIGDWVLRSACEAALRWPGTPAFPVSVNLSRHEILRADMTTRLASVLEETGLDPGRLEIELAESALAGLDNRETVLDRIKSLGVGIVLDDFGTGNSSLADLKDYPIDALKIDASFVQAATHDDGAAAVCEIVVVMAHKMGLTAIAEGVETQEQLALLLAQGCDEVQGYIISRPLPAGALAEWFEGR